MKGYRTLSINALTAIVAIMDMTEFQNVLPDEYLPWVVLGVAVANMWLRTITTTPVGQK